MTETSKPRTSSDNRRLVSAALPPVAGSPGLTQGAYGAAGNLELVVPAADEGFWVLWFNADPVETHQGAAVRSWSGGLHVPVGHKLDVARITQLRAGPNFLEVLVVGVGELRRLYWTPAQGFVDAGPMARGMVAASAMVEAADGSLHALAVNDAGEVGHLWADAGRYPALDWRHDDVPASGSAVTLQLDGDGALVAAVLADHQVRVLRFDGSWQAAAGPVGSWSDLAFPGTGRQVLLGLDDQGRLQHSAFQGGAWSAARPAEAAIDGHALAAASTTLDGGRLDVVVARDGGLWHAIGDAGMAAWSAPEPICSRVWADDGTTMVHRRRS